MSYTKWSVRLIENYFSPGMEGASTWLSASPEELNEIGYDLGGDAAFLESIRKGPEWVSGGGSQQLLATALALYRQWKRLEQRPRCYIDPSVRVAGMAEGGGLNAPPFLPYLVLFARVWHEPKGGFYANLHQLVGADWGPSDLAQMRPLWEGLEHWTELHGGKFGRFSVHQLGAHAHVGLPRAQVLVTPREVDRLHTIFGRSRFRSGSSLPAPQLVAAVQAAPADVAMSAAFKQVLEDPENDLYALAVDRLQEVFAQWDGSFEDPRTGACGAGGGQGDGHSGAGTDTQGSVTVGMALAFGAVGAAEWTVHLHVPAVRGAARMSAKGMGLKGSLNVLIRDDRGGRSIEPVPSLLKQGEQDGHYFQLSEVHSNWNSTGYLPHRPIRSLVREDALDTDGKAIPVLVERPLPNHGGVFFLVSPAARVNFAHFQALASSAMPQEVTTVGLPEHWRLVYFPAVSEIPSGAMDVLPDGQAERTHDRVLRFAGGLRVRRAGVRLYLPYDLPVVELDAPPDARLVAPFLDLEPLPTVVSPSAALLPLGHTTRRFSIAAFDQRLYIYRLEVRGADDAVLGTACLRLSSHEGLIADQEAVGGLGPLGHWEPRDARRRQLLGVELSNDPPHANGTDSNAPLLAPMARPRLRPLDLESLPHHPTVRFLDFLGQAQGRRLSMGRASQAARQVLERSYPGEWFDVPISFLRMRARGLIELQVDRLGRFVSINAPSPCAYTLPVSRTGGGGAYAALGGAVSIDFLRRLQVATGHGLQLGVFERLGGERLSPFDLPAVALKAPSMAALREALGHPDVRIPLLLEPSHTIAAWAASLEVHIRSLDGQSMGPGAGATTQTFFAPHGRFKEPHWSPYGQLYRVEDTDTGRVRLYGMRYLDGGEWRHAPVVRTWGTWHALREAYRFFVPDAADRRVPIPYEAAEGALWVPAALGLPTVLERCLSLCAGQPGIEFRVVAGEEAGPDRVVVCDAQTQGRLFEAATFFGGYLGATDGVNTTDAGPRIWLKYPFVPRDLAARVADLLGGTLA